MRNSGIYIVRLKNELPVPVTQDRRHVDFCATVNRKNLKIGKADNFARRNADYEKDLGKGNVRLQPLAQLENTVDAEKAILGALGAYRKLSPKGGKMEWLEGISYEEAVRTVFAVLDAEGIAYVPLISISDDV